MAVVIIAVCILMIVLLISGIRAENGQDDTDSTEQWAEYDELLDPDHPMYAERQEELFDEFD